MKEQAYSSNNFLKNVYIFILPDELTDYFVSMKTLVEDTFVKTNGQKVMFLTHSMGSPMTLYFLNQQTQAWKDKFVKSWISLAGCWAGTIKALKVYAQGLKVLKVYAQHKYLFNFQEFFEIIIIFLHR